MGNPSEIWGEAYGLCDCPGDCQIHPKEPIKDWEKEFERLFSPYDNAEGYSDEEANYYELLKSFAEQLISQEREKLKAEIREWVIKNRWNETETITVLDAHDLLDYLNK